MASRRVRADDGVELHAVIEGSSDGLPLILLHGFPELGYSWRHQIRPLAQAGYQVIVPDLRGYGQSDVPQDPAAYSIDVLAGDVLWLLDEVGAQRGVLVGHDWGADLAWKAAWMHPDRIVAVAGLSVPFVPRAPAPPVEIMRRHLGEDFYIVWFQEPGVAEQALSRDVRRTLTTPRVWNAQWAQDAGERPARPSFMTEEELAVYVEAFQRTGFAGGLAYYRNIDRNWELTASFDDRRIEQPALFLTGERDPVRGFMPAEAMNGWVTNLRATVVVPGAGHWVNQEAPEQVNSALIDWLHAIEELQARPPAGRDQAVREV
jgi:pimeloyl-ACP methyl ester carboxylesterase